MKNFSFRVRLIRSPRDTINIDAAALDFELNDIGSEVSLCSITGEKSIQDCEKWIFKGNGWRDQESALAAAKQYTDALLLSLARLRIGVDMGLRGTKSAFTLAGLRMLEDQTGHRVLNEMNGIQVYKTNPPPKFASTQADMVRGVSKEHFVKIFHQAVNSQYEFSERERLALELYNASFFQRTSDSRFLLLVMAIESLIEPSPRSTAAIQHVELLCDLTRQSNNLEKEEKDSMLGLLNWLRQDSISQSGRKLASRRLGDRKYLDKTPEVFFKYCYEVRSRLVHGKIPIPTIDETNAISGALEVFVSDLLSGPLLDIDL